MIRKMKTNEQLLRAFPSLNLSVLARGCGVPYSRLDNFKRGRVKLTNDEREKIGKHLDEIFG